LSLTGYSAAHLPTGPASDVGDASAFNYYHQLGHRKVRTLSQCAIVDGRATGSTNSTNLDCRNGVITKIGFGETFKFVHFYVIGNMYIDTTPAMPQVTATVTGDGIGITGETV
jgi:hypothetical protein